MAWGIPGGLANQWLGGIQHAAPETDSNFIKPLDMHRLIFKGVQKHQITINYNQYAKQTSKGIYLDAWLLLQIP